MTGEGLLAAYLVYLVGVSIPGPAIMRIIQISVTTGRRAGVVNAFGVMLASVIWAGLSVLGLGVVLERFPQVLMVLYGLGGMYLLWLAYRAWGKVRAGSSWDAESSPGQTKGLAQLYLAGFAIHATNPKALAVWPTVVLIGTANAVDPFTQAMLVVGICLPTGTAVCVAYALLFGRGRLQRHLLDHLGWLNLIALGVYLFFAVKLLLEPLRALV